MAALLLTILRVLWGIAKVSIPLPLGVIAAAVVLFQLSAHWDKTAAVHAAVKERVTELITGAEKAALEAKLEAALEYGEQQQKIAEVAQRNQYAYAMAEQRFSQIIAQREVEKTKLQERINALLNTKPDPKAPICYLTPSLYYGVR